MTRIAIIGAGAAGSAAADRLRSLLGDEAELVVLEAADRVGGRAHRVAFAGEVLEVGGTLMHSSNRRLLDAAARVGLGPATDEVALGDETRAIGVWDGRRMLLRAGTKGWRFLAALVARYGLGNLRRLHREAVTHVEAWNRVYDLQDAGACWPDVASLLDALGLAGAADAPLRALADRAGISARTTDELATGVLRNMYNQDAAIGGFAGIVGLAGAGLAGGSLFSLGEGNATLFERLLAQAGAEVRLGTPVTAVSARDGRWEVRWDGGGETFDAVVVATPLVANPSGADPGLAGIACERLAPWAVAAGYRRVHVTLVEGRPAPAGLDGRPVPCTLFTSGGEDFTSLGLVGHAAGSGLPVYKFFSHEALTDDVLDRYVPARRDVARLAWDAYPVLEPGAAQPPFRVAPGLYLATALEAVVSTMETESVSAWNAAALLAADVRAGAPVA
ncbi:FAD-dependent oxidoreductase [Nocardioides bruguierae]|uniref:FAD-dependent oxidoreductase n=1 Tax=Nocardioides bruguierae TaxID=2945102 RepID=UPI0020223DF3|nr:FAD-dependent oxidoreductase [Nocardioides bruguierae]MCL8027448.1 FAD-dependent oxidoreductase [Nocardioides bruguierae]